MHWKVAKTPYYQEELNLILFLWQAGFVNTCDLGEIIVDGAVWHATVSSHSALTWDKFSHIKHVFGPISRTETSFNFIRCSTNFNKKCNHAAAVTCCLDMSLASVMVGNPNTNAGAGGAV